MGLEMNDCSSMKFDKSKPGKKGAATASAGEAFWQVLGVVLAIGLVYLVAVSSQHARTVPVESFSPDGTRIDSANRSR